MPTRNQPSQIYFKLWSKIYLDLVLLFWAPTESEKTTFRTSSYHTISLKSLLTFAVFSFSTGPYTPAKLVLCNFVRLRGLPASHMLSQKLIMFCPLLVQQKFKKYLSFASVAVPCRSKSSEFRKEMAK
jgi:hypothetical protein